MLAMAEVAKNEAPTVAPIVESEVPSEACTYELEKDPLYVDPQFKQMSFHCDKESVLEVLTMERVTEMAKLT